MSADIKITTFISVISGQYKKKINLMFKLRWTRFSINRQQLGNFMMLWF